MKTEEITKVYYTLKALHDFTNTVQKLKKPDIISVAQSMSHRADKDLKVLEKELKARNKLD